MNIAGYELSKMSEVQRSHFWVGYFAPMIEDFYDNPMRVIWALVREGGHFLGPEMAVAAKQEAERDRN